MSFKVKKRSGISLWERQKNNEVKLEQHHIITLVEFGQRQSTIVSLCVGKKRKRIECQRHNKVLFGCFSVFQCQKAFSSLFGAVILCSLGTPRSTVSVVSEYPEEILGFECNVSLAPLMNLLFFPFFKHVGCQSLCVILGPGSWSCMPRLFLVNCRCFSLLCFFSYSNLGLLGTCVWKWIGCSG